MAKIVFIGAGSFEFTRTLVRDILSFPILEASEISLMDIDHERLDFANQAVNRIIEAGQYPATLTSTTDRTEALKDADFVVVTIMVGSTDVWRHDIEIPMEYGVDVNVGDTRGVSGIFRALRAIPIMVDIARRPKALTMI